MRLDVRHCEFGKNAYDYYWAVYNKDTGEKLNHCIMCDEEKGEVLVYVSNFQEFIEKYPKAIIHDILDYTKDTTATIFGNFELRKEV